MSGKLACLFWSLCLLSACDGVGRSVVGERAPAFGFGCPKPLACKPVELDEPKAVPEPPTPVDLAQCAQVGATLCPASATTPAGQCPAPPMALTRSFEDARDLGQLACTAAQLFHAPESGEPARVSIPIEAWNQVHLEISSATPATLELVGGQLEHVSLALRGPIALRLLDISRVQDLRVLADDPGASVEALRTHGADLSVAAPHGLLLLRRSRFERVSISAERIDLESSAVFDARWEATSLNAADATLRRIHAAVERSLLSATDMWMVSFASCRSLTAIQGVLSNIQLAACAEETGIYGSAVVHSQLDGTLILDGASLGEVVLGLADPGAIMIWDTQMTDISLCADSQVLTFGGWSDARCVHCNLADEPVDPAACRLDGTDPKIEDSLSCPRLPQLPICGDPQPERMRPPRR